MNAQVENSEGCPMAATVAPEDLRRGDYVAVLSEIIQAPSFLWSESLGGGQDLFVRVRRLPTEDRVPLKIKAICLPFILAKSPSRDYRVLDVRLVSLARLEVAYAKKVWKALKPTSATTLESLLS